MKKPRRERRAAEPVVQASREQVHVLLDAGGLDAGEGVVLATQEDVVVLEAERPVRREAVFEAGADRRTPAGVAGRAEVRSSEADVILVVDHGRTALGVQQHVVPGVTELTGEQAERIGLAVVGEAGEGAHVAARQIRPVALSFDAEHHRAGLPAEADLATDGAAGENKRADAKTENAPAVVAPAAA